MAYPAAAKQLVGSQIRVLSDRKVVRAAGGGARVSSYYDAVKHAFSLKHRLNNDDLADLLDFYAANQTASFDFTWAIDGTTYTCVFGAAGVRVSPGGPYHDVDVELEEV